jgi:NADPH:quinone reductase-like Zn-dependent oxidoreductase
MRAFVLDGYGAIADHVRLAEIADPVPGPGDVRIEIHAASLNPIDFKIVRGDLKRVSKYQLPRPFGFDASGVVTAVGPGSRNSSRAMRSLSARRATRSVRLPSKSPLAKISSHSSRPQFHTRKQRRCRSSG